MNTTERVVLWLMDCQIVLGWDECSGVHSTLTLLFFRGQQNLSNSRVPPHSAPHFCENNGRNPPPTAYYQLVCNWLYVHTPVDYPRVISIPSPKALSINKTTEQPNTARLTVGPISESALPPSIDPAALPILHRLPKTPSTPAAARKLKVKQ